MRTHLLRDIVAHDNLACRPVQLFMASCVASAPHQATGDTEAAEQFTGSIFDQLFKACMPGTILLGRAMCFGTGAFKFVSWFNLHTPCTAGPKQRKR